MDLRTCKLTSEGWFILPENSNFDQLKFGTIPLASVGRHKESKELHGSLTTIFSVQDLAPEYDLVWLHPNLRVRCPECRNPLPGHKPDCKYEWRMKRERAET